MTDYNFDFKQSHRWNEHVRAWIEAFDSGLNVKDVCFNRKKLNKCSEGKNFAPLATSLMYSEAMVEKMKTESRMIKKLAKVDSEYYNKRIWEDTREIMDLFMEDVEPLIGNRFSIDNIVSTPAIDPSKFEDCDLDNLLNLYMRRRIDQEFWTVNSLATSFHMGDAAGFYVMRGRVKRKAEMIASEITKNLSSVMSRYNLKDMKGMDTDHVIESDKVPYAKIFFTQVENHRKFQNCPIYGCYDVAKDYMEDKHKLWRFDELDFCNVCKEHGRQLVTMHIPKALRVISYDRKSCLSEGDDCCDFVTKIDLK